MTVRQDVRTEHERVVPLSSSDIDVALRSDLRRKGLRWYSLYDVDFRAGYVYEHHAEEAGRLDIALPSPTIACPTTSSR